MDYNGTVVSPRIVSYPYFLSCDLDLEVCVKVRSFEFDAFQKRDGESKTAISPTNDTVTAKTHGEDDQTPTELYASAQLFCQGEALHVVGILSHSCSVSEENPNKVRWNEWLTFPVKYRDLEHDACIVFTIWSVGSVCVGRTATYLFDRENGTLRRGRIRLKCTNPKEYDNNKFYNTDDYADRIIEQPRIWELTESFNKNQIQRLDWLDELLVKRINHIREHSLSATGINEFDCTAGKISSPVHFLDIEAPYFDHPVLYEEHPYQVSSQQSMSNSSSNLLDQIDHNTSSTKGGHWNRHLKSEKLKAFRRRKMKGGNVDDFGPFDWENSFGVFRDPEIMRSVTDGSEEKNPVEMKYFKITRSVRRGLVDPDLKPDKTDRAKIQALIRSPDVIKQEDLDLLWKYRHSLKSDKKALTKFVCSVDWNDEQEVKQAAELLNEWKDIDVADALKLLSSEPQFRSSVVRAHAIKILDRARDNELLRYLLQLVQALRYDVSSSMADDGSPNPNYDEDEGKSREMIAPDAVRKDTSETVESPNPKLGLLARFLIRRATQNAELASYFNWYLAVEISANESGSGILFGKVHGEFFRSLSLNKNKMSGVDKEKAKEIFSSVQIQSATFKQIMALGNLIKVFAFKTIYIASYQYLRKSYDFLKLFKNRYI